LSITSNYLKTRIHGLINTMGTLNLRPEQLAAPLPSVADSHLPDSKTGNLKTASAMKRLARLRAGHPLIRKVAKNILNYSEVPSNHYRSEAMAIADYLKENVRYLRDPDGIEEIMDPVLMIEEMRRGEAAGDCDDMSLLLASLLLSVGIRPYFRMVRYSGPKWAFWQPFNHIYVTVYENNPGEQKQRIALDPILKKKMIGYEVPHVSGKEVAV